MRRIIIINGKPRTGKDTFVDIAKTYVNCNVFNLSSVQCVRDIFNILEIEETKTEKQRGQMSKLKDYLTKWKVPNLDIVYKVYEIAENNADFLIFIHVREPLNITWLKRKLSGDSNLYISKCDTLLLKRNTDNVEDAQANNDSDNNVDNYNYDVVIDNDGSLKELQAKVKNYLFHNI